jgi:hypothetical protein
MICRDCEKVKIPKGWFRCDECAKQATFDPSQRIQPVGGATLWRKPNGAYIPKPSA